jgi:hypothetical protein
MWISAFLRTKLNAKFDAIVMFFNQTTSDASARNAALLSR